MGLAMVFWSFVGGSVSDWAGSSVLVFRPGTIVRVRLGVCS